MSREKGLRGLIAWCGQCGQVVRLGFLALLLVCLTGLSVRAQITIPKARDVAKYRDSIAKLTQIDRMKVLFYEGFDATNTLLDGAHYDFKHDKLPDGWKNETVQTSTTGNAIGWKARYGGGWISDPMKLHFPTSGANGTERCATNQSYDNTAISIMVTPPIDLSTAASPILRFYYCSPSRSGVNTMKIQYRLGTSGEWKDVPNGAFLNAVENWQFFTVPLDEIVSKAGGASLNMVQLGFRGEQHMGFGCCIDEIQVLEAQGTPVALDRAEYYSLATKITANTNDQPLAYILLDERSGAGHLRLHNLNGTVRVADGKSVTITKMNLYRTTTKDFSTEHLVSELTFTGSGSTYTITAPKDLTDKAAIPAGISYLWIAADVTSATTKAKLYFEGTVNDKFSAKFGTYIPKRSGGSVTYAPYPDAANQTFAGIEKNFTHTKECTVYAELVREEMENNTTWTFPFDPIWAIGKPASETNSGAKQVDKAYAGDGLLGTAEVRNGKLRGRFWSTYYYGHDESGNVQLTQEVDARHYRDVHVDMMYVCNTSGPQVFLEVAYPDTEGKYDNSPWKILWNSQKMSMMSGWAKLQFNLAESLDRRKFKLRFRAENMGDYADDQYFFVDNFKIIGDEMQKDLGIEWVKPKEMLSYDDGSGKRKLHVDIKVTNYGKEGIAGGTGAVEVLINGEVKATEHATAALSAGGTATLAVDLDLPPQQSRKPQLLDLQVRLKDKDDDPTNNELSLVVPVLGKVTVSDAQSYPSIRGDVMDDWYPQSLEQGVSNSWRLLLLSPVNVHFGAKPPMSYYLWTTGVRECYRYEQSALLSPVFTIEGSAPKTFSMAYAIELDKQLTEHNDNGRYFQAYVEYRTQTGTNEPTEWKRLNQQPTAATPALKFQQNWYQAAGDVGWTKATQQGSEPGYQVAKVALDPAVTDGKYVQFRIVFNLRAFQTIPGMAVSGVEVRKLRPNMKIESLLPPKEQCDRGENGELQLVVKNDGMVPTSADYRVPISVKGTWKHYESEEPTAVPKPDALNRVLAAVDLSNMQPGDTKKVPIGLSQPWWKDARNRIDLTASLNLEYNPDEDMADNALEVKGKKAIVPPFFPVKGLVDVGGTVYISKTSLEAALITKKGNYTFKDFVLEPKSPAAGSISGNKIKVNSAASTGQFVLTYTVSGAEPGGGAGQECTEQKVAFTLLTGEEQNAAIESAAVPVNCLGKDAEEMLLTVQVKVLQGSPSSMTLQVKQNGKEIYKGVAVTGKNELKIPSNKFVSGLSNVEFVLTVDGGDLDLSDNVYQLSKKFFRFDNPIQVFLQASNNPYNVRKLEPNSTTVTAGEESWNLYTPDYDGQVSIQWQKDGQPVGTNTSIALGANSGTYNVRLESKGGCGTETSDNYIIKNDDLDLLRVDGYAEGMPLCRDDKGMAELMVTVQNTSWASYPPDTEFQFSVKVGGEAAQIVKHKLVGYTLTHNGYLQPTLRFKVPTSGAETNLEITLDGVITPGGALEPDAKTDNNKLPAKGKDETLRFTLYSQPTLQISTEPADVLTKGKVFDADGKLTLKPGTSGTISSYKWSSRDVTNYYFEPAKGSQTNGELVVKGIPADVYMLEVKDSHGCKNWDTVFINQTDLVVQKLNKPGSMCDVGETEYLEIQLANRGKQPVIWGDQANVEVNVGSFDQTLPCTLPTIEAHGSAMLVINDTEFMKEFRKAMGTGTEFQINITLTPKPRDMEKLRQSYDYPDCYEKQQFASKWDVDENNNTMQFSIKSYGYPKVRLFALYEGEDDPTKVPDEATVKDREVPGANGTNAPTMSFPNVTRQKFILALRPKEVHDPASVEWKYESKISPYNVASMDIKGDEASLNAAWATWKATAGALYDNTNYARYVPTKEMEEAMHVPTGTTKQPVGQYDVVVTSLEGCVKSFKFTVKPAFYDMAIGSMDGPGALCNLYAQGTADVKVYLKNSGNSTFEKGTQVELELTGKATRTLPAANATLETQKRTITLDEPLRPNGLKQAVFTIDLEQVRQALVAAGATQLNNPKSLDDSKLTFSAKIVSLKTGSGEPIFDENKTNDSKADGATLTDLHDPVRPTINITTTKGSPKTVTSADPTASYTYKYEWNDMQDGVIDLSNETKLKETMSYTLKANPSSGGGASPQYLWTANSSNPVSPNGSTSGQEYQVYGPGLTTLLYSEESEGQRCSVEVSVMVFGTNPDLVISKIRRQNGEPLVACKDNIAAINDVVLDLQNASSKPIDTSDPKLKACLSGKVELHFGEGTMEQVKGTPVRKTLDYSTNSPWASQAVVSTQPFSLEGIPVPSFTEDSKQFLLVAVLKPSDGCEQKPTENDVTQQSVKLIGTPNLQQYVGIEKKTPLTGELKVYTSQAPRLQVASSGQFKNSDFVWKTPDGTTVQRTDCPVDKAGVYTLEGKTLEASCPATASVTVRRPGYLQLVTKKAEEYIALGLEDKCKPTMEFTNGIGDLKAVVTIKNAGQEPLQIVQGDVLKLKIENYEQLENGTSTSPSTTNQPYTFTSALTLAAGEEKQVEMLIIKNFPKSKTDKVVEYKGELVIEQSVAADTHVKDMTETGEPAMEAPKQPFDFIAPPSPEPEDLTKLATDFVADAYSKARPPITDAADLQMVKKVGNARLQIPLQADKSGNNTYAWYKDAGEDPVGQTWGYTVSSSGSYKVKIENKYGCTAVSQPVDIRYTLSYMFSDFKVLGLDDNSAAGGARTCVDAGTTGAKLMPRYEVTLSDAEVGLPAGAKFTVKTAVAAAPTGQPKQTVPTQDVVLVTDKEYVQGDVITFDGNEIPVKENEETSFQATLDLTQEAANKNLDMLPDPAKQATGASVNGNTVKNAPRQFFIALKPQLKHGLMGVEGMNEANEGSYWVYAGKGQIVNYNPISGDESGNYKYTWVIPGSPNQESRDVTIKDKPAYFKLTIEDQANFCTQEYTVNYFKYWRLYPPQVEPAGSVDVKSTFKMAENEVEATYQSTGDVGAQKYERVPDQQLLSVKLSPVSPYKVIAALLFKGPESYNDQGSTEGQNVEGFQQTMSQDIKLTVNAEKGDDPTPGPDPSAVESSLLQAVVVQSPFADQMKLWGVQQLKAYWFTDLVGRTLLYQEVQNPMENITISTSRLPEGLYLLCLQDSEGGVRTLRVVKQR